MSKFILMTKYYFLVIQEYIWYLLDKVIEVPNSSLFIGRNL